MTRADSARLDGAGWGADDWVLLLLATALSLLLVGLVVDLASRGRARRTTTRQPFTLAQLALWLRIGAATAAVLAGLVIIWWAFARMVGW